MRKYGLYFRIAQKIKRFFAGAMSVPSAEDFRFPAVYVGHHQNMYGPITLMTYTPVFLRVWVFSVFLSRKTCYDHFADITFRQRYGKNAFLSKAAALFLSLTIPPLLTSMRSIGVHRIEEHDKRLMIKTFDESIAALLSGKSIAIFPDVDYTGGTAYTGELYSGFGRIDRLFYRNTGQHIPFIPVFASKKSRKILLGSPYLVSSSPPAATDAKKIALAMQAELNRLARLAGDIEQTADGSQKI